MNNETHVVNTGNILCLLITSETRCEVSFPINIEYKFKTHRCTGSFFNALSPEWISKETVCCHFNARLLFQSFRHFFLICSLLLLLTDLNTIWPDRLSTQYVPAHYKVRRFILRSLSPRVWFSVSVWQHGRLISPQLDQFTFELI